MGRHMEQELRSAGIHCDEALTSVFAVLGKRWTGVVIGVLLERPARFAEIARAIPGITESMLSARLTELRDAGLLTREVIEGPPIASLYRLTPSGEALRPGADGARRVGAGAHVGAEREPRRAGRCRRVASWHRGLTKVFGEVKAVDGLSFTVEPGSVTGFLGPNGAGKTTTLRMILGLATPTAGTGTISGVPYAQLPAPGRTVGAVLEATSFHPGRSARNHLRVFCAAAGLPDKRADEVLDWSGSHKRRGIRCWISLGMRQRLGLATALLGNPQVLLLDEPANGLDPEGIAWLRGLLRHFADVDGRHRADLEPCSVRSRADRRPRRDHRARSSHL